jgi:hypothetical protein
MLRRGIVPFYAPVDAAPLGERAIVSGSGCKRHSKENAQGE